jgi:hypothetical protein
MFNIEGNSDELKDSFRSDLQKVLAYSSFAVNTNRHIEIVTLRIVARLVLFGDSPRETFFLSGL